MSLGFNPSIIDKIAMCRVYTRQIHSGITWSEKDVLIHGSGELKRGHTSGWWWWSRSLSTPPLCFRAY